MKNFKEIAEKCLAGELSGRFVCRDGLHISSFTLRRTDNPLYPYKLYRVGKLNEEGLTPNKHSQNDIIQFIPYKEMKKEQITINIPEGMEAVQEIVDGEIRIKFVNRELTYEDILKSIVGNCVLLQNNLGVSPWGLLVTDNRLNNASGYSRYPQAKDYQTSRFNF